MAEITLLLPEHGRVAGAQPGALAKWVARADRLPDAAPGRESLLRSNFEFIGTSLPVAALTRLLDADDAATGLWLRADPAWMMADAFTLRLMACGNVGLSPDESGALARALKPLFGDAGFPLEPATTERWYLRCPPGVKLPVFAAPQVALGDDVGRHLPEGDAGKRWRQLLNEAQVILHNHPVNAARTRRGVAPVNSVWFWGAGKLPDWVRTPYTHVASDDDLARALARKAGVSAASAAPGMLDDIEAPARLLIDLADPRGPPDLERDWLAPIDTLLQQRRLASLDLHFAGGERCRYRHAHRWRFWRRVQPSRHE